jgi:hypothetical protein
MKRQEDAINALGDTLRKKHLAAHPTHAGWNALQNHLDRTSRVADDPDSRARSSRRNRVRTV